MEEVEVGESCCIVCHDTYIDDDGCCLFCNELAAAYMAAESW